MAQQYMINFRQFFVSHVWWGKFLGAILGFLIAGSLGAIVGILVGNFFDRGLAEHFSNPLWQYHMEKREEIKTLFYETVFSVMGHLAKTDGRVSEQEIEFAKKLMGQLRLHRSQRKKAIQCFNQGKKADFNLLETLIQFRTNTNSNPGLTRIFIDIQYRAALEDRLTTSKIKTMDFILKSLGFAPIYDLSQFYEDLFSIYRTDEKQHTKNKKHGYDSANQNQYSAHQNPLVKAYALLGLSPNSNQKEVKQAYRKMISRNHPDKLMAQGLPEQTIKSANEKTQQICKAYEQICSSRGWK